MKNTLCISIFLMFYSVAFSNTYNCNIEIDEILPVYCNESIGGKIEINVSGGEAPYYYKINDGAFSTSNVISNISSDDYDITVRDNKGCEVTIYTYIEIPEPIAISYELEGNTLTIEVDSIGDYKYKLNAEDWVDSPVFTDISEVNKITVKTALGCEISKVIVNEEVSKLEVFKFHPNPAKDIIFVMGTNRIKTIDILDAFGKTVVSHNFNKSVIKLNISDLKSGIYLIQAIDINNRRQVKKLIVN